MKYKTTIKITSEAADKSEALEIVGDYLSGNLMSGVDMKCITAPAVNYKGNILFLGFISLVFLAGVLVSSTIRVSNISASNEASLSAIQPPLKTSPLDNKTESFKRDWQDRQSEKALEYIKR